MARLNLIDSPPNYFSSTLNGAISDSDLTITLNSVSGLPTKGYLVIDRVDSNKVAQPTKRELIYYTSIAGSAVVCPSTGDGRGVGGTTAQSHSDAVVVEGVYPAELHNGLIDLIEAEHKDDGTHDAVTATSLNVSNDAAITSRNQADDADLDLIKANTSDKTTIGQNSVRATRFVFVDSPVQVLNLSNKTDEDGSWIDLDLSANTTSTTYAVALFADVFDNAVGATLSFRKNGSSAGVPGSLRVSNPIVSGSTAGASAQGVVPTDNSQIIERNFNWITSGNNGGRAWLVGYWEYVD